MFSNSYIRISIHSVFPIPSTVFLPGITNPCETSLSFDPFLSRSLFLPPRMSNRNQMNAMSESDLRMLENDDFDKIFENCTPLELSKGYVDPNPNPVRPVNRPSLLVDYSSVEYPSTYQPWVPELMDIPTLLPEMAPSELLSSFPGVFHEMAPPVVASSLTDVVQQMAPPEPALVPSLTDVLSEMAPSEPGSRLTDVLPEMAPSEPGSSHSEVVQQQAPMKPVSSLTEVIPGVAPSEPGSSHTEVVQRQAPMEPVSSLTEVIPAEMAPSEPGSSHTTQQAPMEPVSSLTEVIPAEMAPSEPGSSHTTQQAPMEPVSSLTEVIPENAPAAEEGRGNADEHVQEGIPVPPPPPPQPMDVEVPPQLAEPMPRRSRGRPRTSSPQEPQPRRGRGRPRLNNDRPDWLPAGWTVRKVVRRHGITAGHVDKYFVSPSGRRFRSKNEVMRYLSRMRALNREDEV